MPRRAGTAVSSALLLLFTVQSSAQSQVPETCWYPDGTTQAPDIPCNANASVSACCNEQAFCLSNSLCMQGGLISRGSCTDQSWSDPACPNVCTEVTSDGGVTLQPCGEFSTSPWVCWLNNTGCIDNANTFFLNETVSIVLRAYQVGGLESGNAHTLDITPTTILQTAGNDSNSSSSGSGAATTITLSPSDSSANNNDGTMYTTGQMAGLGVGLSIPLLIALIAALIIIRNQRKQLQKHSSNAPLIHEKSAPSSAYPHYGGLVSQYSTTPSSGDSSVQPQLPLGAHVVKGDGGEVNEADGVALRGELDGEGKKRAGSVREWFSRD